MWSQKILLLLLVIIITAGALRFYKLNEIPVSLYWDEVSIAYNAHSIAETGKDEYGNRLPMLFRAFEDYKTPGYIYLSVIPVKIFGLNEFSVRFTSAFLGTLTVLFTFYLTLEILKRKLFGVEKEHIALLATLFLAISPWHIQFSRGGFEANAGLFFIILGAFLIFKFINTNKFILLLISISCYSISLYFYRSIWLFVPLFLISIFLINYKMFFSKENILKTFLSVTLFFILILPLIPSQLSSQGMNRGSQVSVVKNSDEKVYEFAKKMQNSGELGKIIYNRRVVYAIEITKNYLDHFSPNFLFLAGDKNNRHSVEGIGVLYLWALIFIIPGLYALKKIDKKTSLAIIAWILIAPIPAAISIPSPHALRSLNMLPIPQILIALGVIVLYSILSKKNRTLYVCFMIGMISYFLINYLNLYYGEYAKKSGSQWGDGYRQLSEYVFKNENKYKKVIISGHNWQPYVYFLFYKNYDPKLFQQTGSKASFDKYIFGGTNWDRDIGGIELGGQKLEELSGTRNTLVALSPEEYKEQQDNLKRIGEIYNHNNEIVFILGELE